MQTAEKIRVFLFLAVIAGVYASAFWMLARALWSRAARKPLTLSNRMIWLRRAVFTLAVLGVACMLYARLIEPFWLSVSRVQITAPRWTGNRPLRIVHISDLHCDPAERLEPDLPQAISELRPDLIVFTGDAANSTLGIPVFKACMKRISEIAPTYAVRGNFDLRGRDLFSGTGVRELKGEMETVTLAGGKVILAGTPAGEERKALELIRRAPPDFPLIFLYHYPGLFPDVAAQGRADLYCAGHTHGGQVALPLYGALVTLAKHGKRYEAGLYREGSTWAYVSRGIGMEGGAAPRVRFCARPEVTLIEIAREE